VRSPNTHGSDPNSEANTDGKKDTDSPFAAAEVGTRESSVEGLLVRLKVQGSDQCFLLQTARAVLGPLGRRSGTEKVEMTS